MPPLFVCFFLMFFDVLHSGARSRAGTHIRGTTTTTTTLHCALCACLSDCLSGWPLRTTHHHHHPLRFHPLTVGTRAFRTACRTRHRSPVQVGFGASCLVLHYGAGGGKVGARLAFSYHFFFSFCYSLPRARPVLKLHLNRRTTYIRFVLMLML